VAAAPVVWELDLSLPVPHSRRDIQGTCITISCMLMEDV